MLATWVVGHPRNHHRRAWCSSGRSWFGSAHAAAATTGPVSSRITSAELRPQDLLGLLAQVGLVAVEATDPWRWPGFARSGVPFNCGDMQALPGTHPVAL